MTDRSAKNTKRAGQPREVGEEGEPGMNATSRVDGVYSPQRMDRVGWAGYPGVGALESGEMGGRIGAGRDGLERVSWKSTGGM